MIARAPRKSLMLAAAIRVDGFSAPVRIRNLSNTGAMIDGPVLPEVGLQVELERMKLVVPATVVWSNYGRCGLRLERQLAVEDWVAGQSSGSPFANRQQARVDGIQAAVREGAELPQVADQQATEPKPIPLKTGVARELERLHASLEDSGINLASDPAVLASHGETLQAIDLVMAIVERLAVVLSSEDPRSALDAIDMHDLRSRLTGRATLT